MSNSPTIPHQSNSPPAVSSHVHSRPPQRTLQLIPSSLNKTTHTAPSFSSRPTPQPPPQPKAKHANTGNRKKNKQRAQFGGFSLADYEFYDDDLDFMDFIVDEHRHHSQYHQLMSGAIDVDKMSYEELLALEESIGNVSQGLSSQEFSQLPVSSYAPPANVDPEEACCVICQCEWCAHDPAVTLPCFHRFHPDCIQTWLKDHRTCPICYERDAYCGFDRPSLLILPFDPLKMNPNVQEKRDKLPDISQITPNIFVGNQVAAASRQVLQSRGITRIVRLRTQTSLSIPESIQCTLFCQIEDLSVSDISSCFPVCFTAINEAIQNNERILVHCHAGKSRSPAVVIAFLLQHYHIPLKYAYRHVEKCRHGLGMNPTFKKQLSDLEYGLFWRRSMRFCFFCSEFDCSCLHFTLLQDRFRRQVLRCYQEFTLADTTSNSSSSLSHPPKRRSLHSSLQPTTESSTPYVWEDYQECLRQVIDNHQRYKEVQNKLATFLPRKEKQESFSDQSEDQQVIEYPAAFNLDHYQWVHQSINEITECFEAILSHYLQLFDDQPELPQLSSGLVPDDEYLDQDWELSTIDDEIQKAFLQGLIFND
ncbi:hypothetical protein BLNAU_279 [Blattamonas nauphoetae]|uniref:protein-tyrosine-phosphatase n=1 Tax=Blattamonas nauphoetae TaxID=2049346 RepID=A0ABQ9YMJ1_9EUKA|nr:hypothetical protein BLNAU_279 [Blattamonas nauphoetae]